MGISVKQKLATWCVVGFLVVTGCNSSVNPISGFASSVLMTHQGVHSSALAAKGDLLYASDSQSSVYVYSYPQGSLIEKITGLSAPAGECVDGSGNVWITMSTSKEIVEYAHGGSEPIATLSDPGSPVGCAVDRVSGNLAVTNYYPSAIEVYQQAQGSPTSYSSSGFGGYHYCTYDGSGDLFADGGDQTGMIAELPYGGAALQSITLSEKVATWSMQWDGSYISIVGRFPVSDHAGRGGRDGPVEVYRVAVSGSSGTIVSQESLNSPNGKHVDFGVQYWIAGKTIIGPGFYPRGKEGLFTWRYPQGGHPTHKIAASWEPWGTALSPG